MHHQRVFSGTGVEESSLLGRLLDGLFEASREFRQDPRGYLISAIRGDGAGGRRRQSRLKIGLAIGLIFYSAFFLSLLIVWTVTNRPSNEGGNPGFIDLPRIFSVAPPPGAAMKNGDRDAVSKGGGGGGDHDNQPASHGAPPPFFDQQPLMAPTTRPTLQPPALAMAEHLLGNPANNLKRDELAPTGLPDAPVGPPSDGPGSGKGVGTGKDGGVGSGIEKGLGPGRYGGSGGDDYNNSRNSRRSDMTNPDRVDSRPLALNRPRPNYTEEARKNKVQGVVTARVLVGADGLVRQVKIRGAGLADGLNEEAIRAALQMRFRPAMKDGQPVAYWVVIEIEFNIR